MNGRVYTCYIMQGVKCLKILVINVFLTTLLSNCIQTSVTSVNGSDPHSVMRVVEVFKATYNKDVSKTVHADC